MGKQQKYLQKKAYVACGGGAANHTCQYGCTACGTCVSACPKGAISIHADGVADIDQDACVGCGRCKKACPQGIIHMHAQGVPFLVRCSNRDKGAEAGKSCGHSCIACGLCEKNCPADAVRVTDGCAKIDEERCLSCGNCVVKCPRNVIYDLRGIIKKR